MQLNHLRIPAWRRPSKKPTMLPDCILLVLMSNWQWQELTIHLWAEFVWHKIGKSAIQHNDASICKQIGDNWTTPAVAPILSDVQVIWKFIVSIYHFGTLSTTAVPGSLKWRITLLLTLNYRFNKVACWLYWHFNYWEVCKQWNKLLEWKFLKVYCI